MRPKRAQSRRKARVEAKGTTVRKVSPEQPAARDEGPRLIPLGPAKEAGLTRMEHYLNLADNALSTLRSRSLKERRRSSRPVHGNSGERSNVDPAKEDPPALPEPAAPLVAPSSLPTPHPPRLRLP